MLAQILGIVVGAGNHLVFVLLHYVADRLRGRSLHGSAKARSTFPG
jgi:hypothetical protein